MGCVATAVDPEGNQFALMQPSQVEAQTFCRSVWDLKGKNQGRLSETSKDHLTRSDYVFFFVPINSA